MPSLAHLTAQEGQWTLGRGPCAGLCWDRSQGNPSDTTAQLVWVREGARRGLRCLKYCSSVSCGRGHRAPRPHLLLASETPRGERSQASASCTRVSWTPLCISCLGARLPSWREILPGSVLMCAHVSWPSLVSHTEGPGNVGSVAIVLAWLLVQDLANAL